MEHRKLKIIVERNIPFINGVLDDLADVSYLTASEITGEAMKHTDALVTRTRTRCDSRLLDGSQCRFIATATIGTDHIDLPYCASRGITVANAPGCNAPAVAQWVLSSALRLIEGSPAGKTIGIVGVGHVGSIVDRWARGLGFTTLLCDPPRADREPHSRFVTLDQIARKADIITFHTPLTVSGPHPTLHLADHILLSRCARRPIIMNAARGPVTDTAALIEALQSHQISAAAIDCWENEPAISTQLLQMATIATPHIAGYSREGKVRATQMALDALTAHFGLPRRMADAPEASAPKTTVTATELLHSYNPLADTIDLRSNPATFESLRNTYRLRPEP